MIEKKYLEAIQKLSQINQVSGQLYTNVQSKIEECKKNIINEDIKAANTAISDKDYDNANKYVADILKIDSNNSDAKQLQNTIVQAQQKDKEITEQKQQNSNKSTVINSQKSNNNQSIVKNNEQSQSRQGELESINNKLSQCDNYLATLDKGSQKYRDALDYKKGLLENKLNILESQ